MRHSLSARFATASLIALASASLPQPAWAQPQAPSQEGPALPVTETEQPADAGQPGGDQDIVVTGTRIARDPNAVAPSPISTVSAAEIRNTGQTDVAEVLREVPALISSGTVEDSIERGGGGVGQATLNLRGLGSNRTLVLVNGRRHVSGVAGSQTVDIATIPRALIQSVDILTGGASAIYGADAVTGVVNFNLRRDYQGLEGSAQVGISEQGDGRTFSADLVWGRNFLDNRLNVTVAGSYANGDELTFGQREFTRNNQQASAGLTYANPLRRFQRGDITQTATPNFFERFQLRGNQPSAACFPGAGAAACGRFPFGAQIPTAAQFATQFPGRTPTAAEQSLIDRAANAPSTVLGRDPRFAISSGSGSIARADFDFFRRADIDGNGVNDCFQSFVGFNFGQCYISTPGGGVAIYRDGLISTSTNQLGGDGIPETSNFQFLIPDTQRYDVNLLLSYDFSPAANFFFEGKYVHTDTFSRSINVNGFYDLLFVGPDNPFIPAALRADANEAGGLRVSRDFIDIPSTSDADRDTYRVVAGLTGELTSNLSYQVYGNYGRTENATDSRNVLPDRLFAAIDVVQGPGGPTCASNLDPTRQHPGSEFFPVIGPGFFTFTPGPSSGCVPINLFNGEQAVSAAALDFVTAITTTRAVLEQMVFAAELTGNTGGFFNMPGGPIQFAIGVEYREEKSRTRFDPLVLGLLPSGSPAGAEDTFVGDVDDRQSLVFDGQTRTFDTGGRFDVAEIFGELRVPILADRPFFHELSLEGAARYSDYSTIGNTFTWSVNGIYAPVRDLRIRGTYSKAVRAPNISELFSPEQGTVFRPIDPCDVNQIGALLSSSDAANQARGQRRQTNCAAAGAPPGFTDPLTARFSGTTGGNPDLREETAKTFTAGAVIQPRFIPGLSISGDYYDIKIRNGISAPSAQNIVNSCYEAETFPNQFCDLIERGPNFGFTFLRQRQLNFGRLETAGVDATIAYNFSLGENRFSLRATANWTDKLNQFFDPTSPDVVDPELGETGFPEYSGVGSVSWTRGPVTLGYRLQYIGEQAFAGVEIERQDVEFGPEATADEYFVHDISFSIDATDRFTFYGGVNNLTDEEPYANRASYPVSPVGRFYFVGARARF